jgi:hypothetical protein
MILKAIVRRLFNRRGSPGAARILFVESGSRALAEHVLPALRQASGGAAPLDLLTCYTGLPVGLDPESVYRVSAYGPDGRRRLYQELSEKRYSVLAILCSDEPVLTKWKFALALLLPCRVLIFNENGDYFWLNRAHLGTALHFVLFRAGLTGPDAVRTLARAALIPFTLLYLLLYASVVHMRRMLRKGVR